MPLILEESNYFQNMSTIPSYEILFIGYRLDSKVATLPHDSGVYLIYRCIYNEEKNEVQLKELFYIGKATDLYQEVGHHKRRDEFLAKAQKGEEICYSYALVDKKQYDIIENALIFMQKPKLNTNLRDSYDHQDAEFHFSGRCAKLKTHDYKIESGILTRLP